MNKFYLTILFLFTISLTAFSQVKPTYPQIRINGSDTEYVFNRSQATMIAIDLEQGKISNQIRRELIQQIVDYKRLITIGDTIMSSQSKIIEEYKIIDVRNQKVIENKDKEIEILNKSIRRQKFLKIVGYTTTGVMIILYTVK